MPNDLLVSEIGHSLRFKAIVQTWTVRCFFFCWKYFSVQVLPSVKLTAKAPENGWLEY